MTKNVKDIIQLDHNIDSVTGSGRSKEPFATTSKLTEIRDNAKKKEKQIQERFYTPRHNFEDYSSW